MGGDCEEESAVAAGMAKLAFRRATKRNATEDERTGAKGEFLLAVFSLFADDLDGIQMLQLALVNSDNGRDRSGSEVGLRFQSVRDRHASAWGLEFH